MCLSHRLPGSQEKKSESKPFQVWENLGNMGLFSYTWGDLFYNITIVINLQTAGGIIQFTI